MKPEVKIVLFLLIVGSLVTTAVVTRNHQEFVTAPLAPLKCVCDTENLERRIERRIEQAEHQLERQDSRINRHAFSLHKHNLLEAEPVFRPDCSQGFQPWDGGCVSNEEVIKKNLWGEVKRP